MVFYTIVGGGGGSGSASFNEDGDKTQGASGDGGSGYKITGHFFLIDHPLISISIGKGGKGGDPVTLNEDEEYK